MYYLHSEIYDGVEDDMNRRAIANENDEERLARLAREAYEESKD